jgi:hypothetical protein
VASLRAPTINGHLVRCRVSLRGDDAVEPSVDVPRLPAAERARELASSVVEAATFQLGGSRWKLLTGALLVHENGSTSLHDRFEDPDRRRAVRRFRAPTSDPTGGALDAIDDGFVTAVAAGLPHARESVEEVRWYEAAETVESSAQRLALHVRALEHALPIVPGETWVDPVRRYLREHWVLDQVNRIVFGLAHHVGSELRHIDPKIIDNAEQFIVWDDADSSTDRNFTVTYGALVRNADKLSRALPKRMWTVRRALRELHRSTATGAAAVFWLDELGQEFDTRLNRAVRQRNAIVHGMSAHPPVVETVVAFVAQLSAYVVAQTVHRVSFQLDPLGAFEKGRADALMIRTELETSTRPVPQILWSPRTDEGS